MDPGLAQAVDSSREVLITTFDDTGKPGTVPVWFDYHDGEFYVSTYPDSLKVRKILRNGRAELSFGTRGEPGVTGSAVIVSDAELIDRIAPVHHERYAGNLWRSAEHLAQMWKEARERVLIRITPDQ